jgi:hypothetical protein
LFQIFLFAFLFGHNYPLYADDPVFSLLDNEDFDQLDLYLADHDINAQYGDSSSTLLVYSILNNKNSVTRYLIEKGANVNQYVNGKSPIMFAAEKGYKSKVSLLASQNAEINSLDADGNTALILEYRFFYGITQVDVIVMNSHGTNAFPERSPMVFLPFWNSITQCHIIVHHGKLRDTHSLLRKGAYVLAGKDIILCNSVFDYGIFLIP